MSGKTFRLGMAAGLAGGAAEIAWVVLYGAATGTPVAVVARGVTAALFPSLTLVPQAALIGIALHMLLAIGLGVAVVAAFSTPALRRIAPWPQSLLVVLALGSVWACNFLIVLPRLDPDFLVLLPVAVTLASKLLFGVSAAAVLRARPFAAAFAPTDGLAG